MLQKLVNKVLVLVDLFGGDAKRLELLKDAAPLGVVAVLDAESLVGRVADVAEVPFIFVSA